MSEIPQQMYSLTPALLGLLIGGIIGIVSPIILDEYRVFMKERRWSKPRKALLIQILKLPKHKFATLERLARTTGTTDEQCRTLLIEIGARGAKLRKSGSEAWGLISRAPFESDQSKEISEDSDIDA